MFTSLVVTCKVVKLSNSEAERQMITLLCLDEVDRGVQATKYIPPGLFFRFREEERGKDSAFNTNEIGIAGKLKLTKGSTTILKLKLRN